MVPHRKRKRNRLWSWTLRVPMVTPASPAPAWIDPDRDLISIILTNRVHPRVNMAGKSRARISAMLAEYFRRDNRHTNACPGMIK